MQNAKIRICAYLAYRLSTLITIALVVVIWSIPAAAQVNCGDTVDLSTFPGRTITLTQDLECIDDAPGLTLIGPGTFNMNGHKMLCKLDTNDGLTIDGQRVTVQNGIIQGCRYGIVARGVRHLVERMLVKSSDITGMFILADRSSIRESTSLQNSASGSFISGRNTRVDDHLALDNGGAGFNINDENINVRNNAAIGNGSNGLFNGLSGLRTRIQGNIASGNIQGVRNAGNRSSIIGNISTHNSEGIENTHGATLNRYIDNLAFGNTTLIPGRNLIAFDIKEERFDCETTTWRQNTFTETNRPECVE